MRFYFILLVFIFIPLKSLAQTGVETLREQAYEAKLAGQLQTAIDKYSQILKQNPDDYDAKLALARLFYTQSDYKTARKYYQLIYKDDATDVEALYGLGNCSLMTDHYTQALQYFQKSLQYKPDFVPAFLQLAKTYSWQGNLDKAIETYRQILDIDDTYSEAWQGIGKMYYWKNKPYSAIKFYKKAVALDPANTEISNELQQLVNETKFQINGKFSLLNETEENYEINALVQKYDFIKRLNDHFQVGLHTVLDYSHRDFYTTSVGDTTRWYHNTYLKLGYITPHNQISVYGGYTFTDQKFSSYGIDWKADYNLKNINVTNSLTAGYDYFYYWNQVGQKEISNTTVFKYKKTSLSVNYSFGIIDSVMIADIPNDKYYVDFNKHTGYGVSASYQVLSYPKINVSANYSYLNYQYKSTLYYSPMGRHLYGPSVMIYYPLGKFYYYGNFAYNFGSEYYYENIENIVSKHYLDVGNWSVENELGYQLKKISLSLGGSRFYNNYYTNFQVFVAAKAKL